MSRWYGRSIITALRQVKVMSGTWVIEKPIPEGGLHLVAGSGAPGAVEVCPRARSIYDETMRSIAALLVLVAGTACDDVSPWDPRDAGADGSVDASGDTSVDAEADAPPASLTECGYWEGRYGLATGDVLEPFMLWDCDGGTTSLARLWCHQGATIIHISSGWCSVCEEATELLLSQVLEPLAGQPVRLIEVFSEEGPDVVAGVEGCRHWSRLFDPPLDVYIPPHGSLEGSLERLATSGAPPLTVLLDDEGRIREWHRTMVPDMIPTDMDRLRRTIEEILEEPP